MLSQATARLTVPPSSAVGRFSGFNPSTEGVQPVRQPLFTGDDIQRLRDVREMLRSMTPEQALEIIEWHGNLTLFQAVSLAKETGKLIVPNDVIDGISTQMNYVPPRVRTGTMVVYEGSGKPFGDIVFYGDIRFSIPIKFQGKVNCALVVEHPDFDLISKGENTYWLRITDENRLILVTDFPRPDGWYVPYAETGIPHGQEVGRSTGARYLFRLNNSSYVGPLVRLDGHRGQGVGAGYPPSDRFGVALF